MGIYPLVYTFFYIDACIIKFMMLKLDKFVCIHTAVYWLCRCAMIYY